MTYKWNAYDCITNDNDISVPLLNGKPNGTLSFEIFNNLHVYI